MAAARADDHAGDRGSCARARRRADDAGTLRQGNPALRGASSAGRRRREARRDLRNHSPVNIEKITVRVTSTGQTMEVVVFSKRPTGITVVLGEGVHNM